MSLLLKAIYQMINKLICKIKGHMLQDAGTCPFTGNTYKHCTRCKSLAAIPSTTNKIDIKETVAE